MKISPITEVLILQIEKVFDEHAELVEALERLADIVHARLCWEHDYGKPPSSLDALIEARAILEKVK